MCKNKIVFLINLLALTNTVFCQNDKSINIDFINKVFYGTSYEIIYNNAFNLQYSSELKWDMKPLWLIGFNIEYGPKEPLSKNGFWGSLELLAGLPMKTGSMEDRDWLNPTTVPGSLTLFSSHENKTVSAINADLKGGLSFFIKNNLFMKLFVGITYMNYKYEAWNGYLQYGENNRPPQQNNPYKPWDSSWDKTNINGLGIKYSQHWFILKPGISITFSYKNFYFISDISFTPLVFCYAEDNHLLRNPPFFAASELSGGIYIEPKVSIFYLYKKYGFGLKFSYSYIDNTRGDIVLTEYYPSENITNRYYNISAANFRAFAVEVVFRIYL